MLKPEPGSESGVIRGYYDYHQDSEYRSSQDTRPSDYYGRRSSRDGDNEMCVDIKKGSELQNNLFWVGGELICLITSLPLAWIHDSCCS